MTHKKLKSEDGTYVAEVTISKDLIEVQVNQRISEIAKTANIQGFRAGKVPAELIKKRHGSDINKETLSKKINEAVINIEKEKKLDVMAQPELLDVSYEEGSDLVFKVCYYLRPDIKLPDINKLELKKPNITMSDEQIQEKMEELANKNPPLKSAAKNHKVKNGNVVILDFEGYIDDVPFPGGKADKHSLEIGSNTFIPGFESSLVGLSVGYKGDIEVTFPKNYGSKELAGKKSIFKITIHDIKIKEKAKLDDAFFKSFGLKDKDSFKEVIKSTYQSEASKAINNHFREHIIHFLMENAEFKVSDKLIDMEFNSIWKQLEQQKATGQLSPEDAGKSDEELRTEYRDIAHQRLSLGLVFQKYALTNDVSVSDQDLEQAIRSYVSQMQVPDVKKAIESIKKNQQQLNQLHNLQLERNIIEHIIKNSKGDEVDVAIDDIDIWIHKNAPSQEESKSKKASPKKAKGKSKATADEKPKAKKASKSAASASTVKKDKKATSAKKAKKS